MQITIDKMHINGVDYISVKQFAMVTNRSDQNVYLLIKKGNSIRKMKSLKIGAKVLIPVSEITEFPFTCSGKNARDHVYHYTEEGKIVEENICEHFTILEKE